MIDAAILTQENLSCIDCHLASREAFMPDDVILTEENLLCMQLSSWLKRTFHAHNCYLDSREAFILVPVIPTQENLS